MKSGIGVSLCEQGVFGPAVRANPYPTYKRFRETDPVHWEETLKAWVLTRYDDVALALNDRRFSSSRVEYARHLFADPKWEPLFETLAGKMSEKDEPDHKRQRALVHDAFIRTSVQQWEPRIQQRVDGLLSAVSAEEVVDFMSEVAVPLPMLVIFELIGIPAEDRQEVKSWCDDFAIVALNYYAGISEQELQRGLDSTLAFKEYLRVQADKARESPRQDLLSSLVHASYEGSSLTLEELLANCLLLITAGNETTTCLLGNGLTALLRHPYQMQLLQEDPTKIPHAIEEFLRYDGPVQFLGRITLEEVALHETTIKSGEMVLAVMAAANHDPDHFDRPEELDITRASIPHLAFGHGPHFCVGSQLARLEAKIAFTTLLSRFPNMALDESQQFEYRENFNMRCLQKLQIRFRS